MATATKKSVTPPIPEPTAGQGAEKTTRPALLIRAFDAVFQFLASLKLAVICLAALSLTLAVGTWFNSNYGQLAVDEYLYKTKGFALLLAFLAINILCAALIRYPWTKRQTGFVITHLGLLITIAGSWWSAQSGDEGLIGMREGDTSSSVVRQHKPTVYVEPVDPHSGRPNGSGEKKFFFYPGAFNWQAGRYEVITGPKDPYKLAVKGYYPASSSEIQHEADPAGSPMIKIRPKVIPPGATEPMDVFPAESQRWLAIEGRFPRVFKDKRPAQFNFTYVGDRPELMDDFVHPPANHGIEGVARLRYDDKDGKPRAFDVRLDDARPGQAFPLPDSDLTATFSKVSHNPIDDPAMKRIIGDDSLNVVEFLVRRGDGTPVAHNGFAMAPTMPAVIPSRDNPGETPRALLAVNYYYPPIVDPQVNNRYGVIEVMGDKQGRLAYRVFERGSPGKLRSSGELKLGQEVTAFGGDKLAPMTMTFQVDEFFQGGREVEVAVPIKVGPNQMETAIAAILAEMTVGGVTRDVWLFRSPTLEPIYQTVTFPDGMYRIAFDVDRLDLGFSLHLKDFDVGYDPGSDQASSYRSDLTMTDEAAGIKEKPVEIYMNHTFDYKGWRFFQTNFQPYVDPKTRKPTGEFISTFQVSKNPAREVIYAGCIIVVLGAFVQFYMRAGVFSDGGKKQQAREADSARRRLEAKMTRGNVKAKPGKKPVVVPPAPSPTPTPAPAPPAADDFEPL